MCNGIEIFALQACDGDLAVGSRLDSVTPYAGIPSEAPNDRLLRCRAGKCNGGCCVWSFHFPSDHEDGATSTRTDQPDSRAAVEYPPTGSARQQRLLAAHSRKSRRS